MIEPMAHANEGAAPTGRRWSLPWDCWRWRCWSAGTPRSSAPAAPMPGSGRRPSPMPSPCVSAGSRPGPRSRPFAAISPSASRRNRAPVLWIVGGLVAQMVLIKTVGFSIATGVLFAMTARGFGRVSLPQVARRRHPDLGLRLVRLRAAPATDAARRAVRGSHPPGRRDAHCPLQGFCRDCCVMDTLALLLQGLTVAIQPINLLYALVGVTLGTAVGVLPGIGPATDRGAAAAGDLQARPRRLADHVRRHLLRRHVWRLDDLDPAQHAGRKRLDRHRARGQQDGQGRARRTGAGDGGHRLVRRRPDRDDRAGLPRAVDRQVRAGLRAARVFRADGARLRHRLRRLRRFRAARAHLAVHRPDAGADRHRPADRPGAAELRHARPARRRRGHDAGGRHVRHRRDAVRRGAGQAGAGDGGTGARARSG